MELLQNLSSGKKNKFRKKKTVETIFIACMLLYPMFNFAIFYIWGNLTSVVMAFQKTNTTTFESEWVGLYQFRRFINELIEQPNIWLYIKNALLYFIILLALGMPFNLIFAYMLYTKIKGADLIRWALLIPAMISGMVTAMLFSKFAESALPFMFEKLFNVKTLSLLIDERFNFWTIIFYQLISGFSSNVIIYSNSMTACTSEMLESAKIDGANHMQILWYMCVPLAMPTVTTYIVTGVSGIFACSGGTFLLFYQYNAPQNVIPLGYFIFTLSKNSDPRIIDYSYATAINLIFTAVTLPLVFLTKQFMDRFDPYREM